MIPHLICFSPVLPPPRAPSLPVHPTFQPISSRGLNQPRPALFRIPINEFFGSLSSAFWPPICVPPRSLDFASFFTWRLCTLHQMLWTPPVPLPGSNDHFHRYFFFLIATLDPFQYFVHRLPLSPCCFCRFYSIYLSH